MSKGIVVAFAEMVGIGGIHPRYELKMATIDSPVDMLSCQMKAYLTFLDGPDLSVILASQFSYQPLLATADTLFPAEHFHDVVGNVSGQVDFDFLIANTPSLEVYQLERFNGFDVCLVILNNLKLESRLPSVRFLHHSFNMVHFSGMGANDPMLQHIFKEIDNKQLPISR